MKNLIITLCCVISWGVSLHAVSASPAPVQKDWEKIADTDGVLVWKRDVENSPIVAFKGKAVMEASIAKVAQVLIDTSRKKEWVAKLADGHDIKQISETERIEYNRTMAPLILSDRDFVFHAKMELNKADQSITIKIKSVEDAAEPVRPKYVRGELIDSSYTLKSVDGGQKTEVTVEIQVDPKGMIPKWVANMFQKDWPRITLDGIRKQVAKPDVIENEKIKAFFAQNTNGQ